MCSQIKADKRSDRAPASFTGKGRVFYFIAAVAAVILIGVADLLTGYHLAFSIFYLLPITLAAMALGRDEGILLAVLSGAVWVTADILSGNQYPGFFLPIWNMLVRTFFFSLPVYIVEQNKMAKELKAYRRDLESRVSVAVSKEKEVEHKLEEHREHLERLVEERTQDLEESEKKFRLAFENALDAIIWADPDSGIILNCNKSAEGFFEKPRAELIGRPQTVLHPPDQEEYYAGLFSNHAKNTKSSIEAEITTRSGKTKTVLISASTIEIKERLVMQGIFHDITGRKEMEKALKMSEESYRSIFESANDAIIVRDIKTYKLIDANNRACEMFCYSREEMVGMPLQAMIAEDLPHKLQDAWSYYDRAAEGEPQVFEILAKDKPGRNFYAEVSLRRAIIGDRYCLLGLVRDITERKDVENRVTDLNKALSKANDSLKHMALRDSQTGLYNHRYFASAIEAEFERSKRYSEELSIIMMDIDYFKSINDVYGHQFGDLTLRQFAKLLRSEVRLYDVVVRFGGEEFIIISPNTGRGEASILAHRLLNTIALHSFGDKKHSVKIKVSAAICSYPADKRINNPSDFVDTADRILDGAKEAGGNRVYSLADLENKRGADRLPEIEPTVDELKEKIKKLTTRGNQSVVEAIFAFAKTIELKDRYTGEHMEKTIRYVTGIAHALGLPKDEIETIKEASALHDLGKIGIPEKILLKPGKLTEREREIIKEHPQIGVDIIRPLHFLRNMIPLIRHHHEWWNGRGYPDRLKKEAIPLGARIIAIADVYQALTSDRPYHKAYQKEESLRIIKDGAGTQFDPKIVETFLAVLEKE